MERIDHDLYSDDQLDDYFIFFTLVLSVVFFAVLNEALRHGSKHYVILQKTSEWRFRNLAISWVHANFCAVGCFYCYFMYGESVQSFRDLFDLKPLSAFILVAFSVGYFTYDLLEHGRQGKLLSLWEVTLHHIAVISIFTYNLVYHFCVAFAVLALIVEINSVFLHGRKLLQMLHVPFSHWLYRVTVALNLVSFVFFRGLALVLIWAGFLLNLHRCSTVYTVSLGVVMVFMVILNPVLFWRLLRSDLLRSSRRKTTKNENGEAVRQKKPQKGSEVNRTEELQEGTEKRTGDPYSSAEETEQRSGKERSHTTKDSFLINTTSSRNGFKVLHRTKAS